MQWLRFLVLRKRRYKLLNESSAGRKGTFIYPGIRAGTWIITESSKNDNNPMMLAHVIFDDQPNHTYIATLSKFGQSDVVTNLESAMANIVIPSMQSLDTLDSISDLITWEILRIVCQRAWC